MITFKRIWRLISGNRLLYVSAIIATGLATLFNMVPPLIVSITVDSVLSGEPLSAPAPLLFLVERIGGVTVLARNIWLCSLGVVLFSVLNGLFAYFRARFSATAAENIARTMKDNLYDHLQKLPYEFHVKAQTGDLIQRCTSDVETIRRFLASDVIEIVRTVLVMTFSLIVMSSLNVRLTLISLIILPFIFLFSYFYFRKVRASFKLADEKEGELSTVLQENLTGVRVVRAFGRQKYEEEKFDTKNAEFRELGFKVSLLMAYFWSISDLMAMGQIGIILFSGVYMTIRGELTLGTLIAFNSYAGMLIWPLRQLGRMLSDMGKMEVSLGRVNEILHTPEEKDTEGAKPHDLKGDIIFEDVGFYYDENNPILKGMSFCIKNGETIAFLGATGSGKSTIMHILLRLYDYASGSVRINGEELRMIEKKHLREKIGLVLQEPFLYSKTIRNNLKMAKYSVEDSELYDATRTAAVHDVIEGFEQGYETLVGEKGVTLSGGQKQRVAIARTLIKTSDILIFDDSLSAVDTETDAQIRAALKEKRQDTTTIIISQRITTLMEADRIFVLENGVVTDTGKHEDLIARDGLYARIWRIQNMLEEDFEEEVG